MASESPPAALNLLFQPFYRSEAQKNRAGLGLGLYIAHEIAAAHGGTLGVEVGEGFGFMPALVDERLTVLALRLDGRERSGGPAAPCRFLDRLPAPAFTVSLATVASPSRTRPASISAVKPCAIRIAAVLPRGPASASRLSARRCSASSFITIGGAREADTMRGPKRRRRNVVGPPIGAHDGLVVAGRKDDRERADTELPHVAQRHRHDRIVVSFMMPPGTMR